MNVWIPLWSIRSPAALDLAVTNGLGMGLAASTAANAEAALVAYDRRKREHLGTDRACRGQGFAFIPLVAEACSGGWGPTAVTAWGTLGRQVAARTGNAPAVEQQRRVEALSVALQRENARAVLRRLPCVDRCVDSSLSPSFDDYLTA